MSYNRIEELVKKAVNEKSVKKRKKLLEDIPDGIVYSKKLKHDGIIITYEYSDKRKFIMKYLYDLDIVENTEELIKQSIDDGTPPDVGLY